MNPFQANDLKFTSATNGRKPSTEARLYVYRVLCSILDNDSVEPDGWMFGGITEDADKQRLHKAIKAVREELRKKGDR